MPFVNIKVTREAVTTDNKLALIRGITELLVEILDKDPQMTHVVIDEIDTDNWGIGGNSVSRYRQREK